MRISLPRRFRRISAGLLAGICVVATASCSSNGEAAAEPPSSSAAPSSASGAGTYLALGDSLPFGSRNASPAEYADDANFAGYPELVGARLGLEVLNASCPGETTASFLDADARRNGCPYRAGFPLHVNYESRDQSQFEFALQSLTGNDDVELVTVQLGANDAFACQRSTPSRCTDAADLEALAQTVQGNLDAVLTALREQYDGQIVVVTYYALDYDDAFGAATGVLDSGIAEIATANGADVADGYEAFRARAAEAGGDSVAAGLVLPDDVHATDEGQRLLAEAVLAVVEG